MGMGLLPPPLLFTRPFRFKIEAPPLVYGALFPFRTPPGSPFVIDAHRLRSPSLSSRKFSPLQALFFLNSVFREPHRADLQLFDGIGMACQAHGGALSYQSLDFDLFPPLLVATTPFPISSPWHSPVVNLHLPSRPPRDARRVPSPLLLVSSFCRTLRCLRSLLPFFPMTQPPPLSPHTLPSPKGLRGHPRSRSPHHHRLLFPHRGHFSLFPRAWPPIFFN